MDDDVRLSPSAKLEVAIQAGLSAIPFPGGSLATLYFGFQQEKRFARIEKFLGLLKEELQKTDRLLLPIQSHDQAALAEVIQEILHSVEADLTERNREYYKNCFLNALQQSNQGISDKRRRFVSLLRALSAVEIEILSSLRKAGEGKGFHFQPSEVEGSGDFNASLESLRGFGLLNAHMAGPITPNVNWGSISHYRLSVFGREFCDFCLTDEGGAEPKSAPRVDP